MTQLNLLPNVKIAYLKAEKARRLVIVISVLVTIAAIVVIVFLFTLTEVQKAQINNLSSDIKTQGQNLSGQSNLNDILTIQNQIATLNSLHQQEPAVANLATYLNQIVPVNANLSSLSIDFKANTVNLTGSADSLATVNQLVDSLKFATYSLAGVQGTKSAFSNVVLTSFSYASASSSAQHQPASFTINLSFDPTLFNITDQVTLTLPSKVTTRSQLGQPTSLFSQSNGG